MAGDHLPKEGEEIWEKYSMTYDTLAFINWYTYMYGSYDKDLMRILEKPWHYSDVFEEFENDKEWHGDE